MLRYKEFQEELQPNFNSFNKQVRKLTLSPSAGIVPEDTRCIPVLHLSELSAFCWSRSQTDSVMRKFRLNIRKLISNEDGDVYETVSKKKKKSHCMKLYPFYRVYLISFNSSNLGIMHFHVVVAQWRQRNVQKRVMHLRLVSFCQSKHFALTWYQAQ